MDKRRKVRLLVIEGSSKVPEVFEALGEAAGEFGDNGWHPDGVLWLRDLARFSAGELASALAAGAVIRDGYEIPYSPDLIWERSDFCGYSAEGVAYILAE